MAAPELVAAQRAALGDLTTLAVANLTTVWAALDVANADATRNALLEVVPPLVETYGVAAASLSADFYDDMRADAAVGGRFRAIPAEPADSARARAMVRWGVDPLFGGSGPADALTLLVGGLQRLVLAPGRDTVRDAVSSDPKAKGWQRFAKPGACRFCRMLQGRGNVYGPDTARFAAHDSCHCVAAPAFSSGRSVTVEQYTATKKTVTEADRSRLRVFMAAMDS